MGIILLVLAIAGLLGALSNRLRPRAVAGIVGMVGLALFVAMAWPDFPPPGRGAWRFLYTVAFYWLWTFSAYFLTPFLIGRYGYKLARKLAVE